jgi:hypothetical protein
VTADACGYGTASPAVILACDYTGMYETHYCAETWDAATVARLDEARSVADLTRIWARLEKAGHVDAYGGAEWHHAVSHLRWHLEQEAQQ